MHAVVLVYPGPPLFYCHCRDGTYSQDTIELGLTLMAAQLTTPQAVSVMRAFVRAEYPEKKEGVDYRIPDSSSFREWRPYLEPISHYIGILVLKLSVRSHLLNDATTKNHVHVYQSCFRCKLKDQDGETVMVDVPIKFKICPEGNLALRLIKQLMQWRVAVLRTNHRLQ